MPKPVANPERKAIHICNAETQQIERLIETSGLDWMFLPPGMFVGNAVRVDVRKFGSNGVGCARAVIAEVVRDEVKARLIG